VKVLAGVASALALDEIDAHNHQSGIGVHGTRGGRMSVRTLVRRLLAFITVLKLFTYLRLLFIIDSFQGSTTCIIFSDYQN
jgi:hypothetical protein